jgi:hypothetical protein
VQGSGEAEAVPEGLGEAEPSPERSGEAKLVLEGSGEAESFLVGSDQAAIAFMTILDGLRLMSFHSYFMGTLILVPDKLGMVLNLA